MRLIKIMVMTFFICTAFLTGAIAGNPMTLSECLDIAIANNSKLTLSNYSLQDADLKRKEALTQFLPKLSAKATYLRYDSLPTIDIPPMGSIPFGSRDNLSFSLELTQPVFTGGRIMSAYNIAKEAYSTAKYSSEVSRKDIVKEVTVNYFNVLKAKKFVEIAKSSKELIGSHLSNVENFFEVGSVPKNDVLSAKVSHSNAQIFLIKARNGYELAKSALNYSLNKDVNDEVILAEVGEGAISDNVVLEDCFDKALSNREELKIINNAKSINESLIDIQRSAYYPQLYLIGSYNKTGDEEFDEENFTGVLSMELEIFSWGGTSYKVESSKLELKKVYENEAVIKRSIRLEVKAAYLMLRQAREEVNSAKQAVEQAKENYRINEEKFNVNAATSTEVLDAQNLLLTSKINYFQALYDVYIADINLKRATGEIDY